MKNIPKDEIRWVSYKTVSGETKYTITSKLSRDCYYLYEHKKDGDGCAERIGKAKTPIELENKFNIIETIKY